ncbi:hypothetical protein AC578_4880, partial [Pseudocercospora eumusae]
MADQHHFFAASAASKVATSTTSTTTSSSSQRASAILGRFANVMAESGAVEVMTYSRSENDWLVFIDTMAFFSSPLSVENKSLFEDKGSVKVNEDLVNICRSDTSRSSQTRLSSIPILHTDTQQRTHYQSATHCALVRQTRILSNTRLITQHTHEYGTTTMSLHAANLKTAELALALGSLDINNELLVRKFDVIFPSSPPPGFLCSSNFSNKRLRLGSSKKQIRNRDHET